MNPPLLPEEQARVLNAADLPAPEILAREIMEELQVAMGEFTAIVAALGGEVD
jgi:hypothetical protein